MDAVTSDIAAARWPDRPAALIAGNLAVAGAWAARHGAALAWTFAQLARSPLHLGLLVVIVVLLARGLRMDRQSILAFLRTPPRLAPLPLALLALSMMGYLLAERYIDISILSATLFGLGTYGLAGLWLDGAQWRRGLPAALLLVGVLPFGDQADSYAGFAARAWTARVTGDLMHALGLGAVQAETILVLENGVAHVDVPCSGVRSLWTGLLFFLAATCLLRRRPGLRWMLAGAFHVALLVIANLTRVAALTLLAVAARCHHAAEIVHAPLGILGFALACATTLALLRRTPGYSSINTNNTTNTTAIPVSSDSARPWLAPALVITIAAAAIVHTRRPVAAAESWAPRLSLPAEYEARELPLTAAENDLYRRHGGVAHKLRVKLRYREATLLAVFSRSFRAHHAPEVCLAGSGVHVDHVTPIPAGACPGSDARLASLDGGRRAAVYWYQSPTRITGDILTRTALDLSGRERRWVQISLLVDGNLHLEVPDDQDVVDTIRDAAARALATTISTDTPISRESLYEMTCSPFREKHR